MKLINLVNHAICPDLLKPSSVVIDLGANVGAFANEMAGRFHCQVYAVEASPRVFEEIPTGSLVQKFNFAICATSGPITLNVSSNSEATSLKRLNGFEYIETATVPGLRLDDFIKNNAIPQPDLLKVDIEGAEIEVFNSCSDAFLESIDQITVEFHEWLGISSRAEVEDLVRRLRGLGFFSFKLARENYSDVLFVNRRHLSRLEYTSTLLAIWVPRIFRAMGRRLRPPKREVVTPSH